MSLNLTIQTPPPLKLVVEPPPIIKTVFSVGQGPSGIKGDKGDQGDQGLPGISGASVVHDQGISSSTWVIQHNLGRFPSVTVIDSTGDEVEGDVKFIDANLIHLVFSAPFAGKAFIN